MKNRLKRPGDSLAPVAIALYGSDYSLLPTFSSQKTFVRRLECHRWKLKRDGTLVHHHDGDNETRAWLVLMVDPGDEITYASIAKLPALFGKQLTRGEVQSIRLRVMCVTEEDETSCDHITFDEKGVMYVESIQWAWETIASLSGPKKR